MAQLQPVQDVFGLSRLADQIRANRMEAAQAPIRAAQTELLQGRVQQQRHSLADLARTRQEQADLQAAIQAAPEQDVDQVSLDFFRKRNPAKAQRFEQMIFDRAAGIAKFDPQGASDFLNLKTGSTFDFKPVITGPTPAQRERELGIKEAAQKTREAELEISAAETKRKARELKPTMQRILDTAQTMAFESEKTANEFDLLVDDFRGQGFEGGVVASIGEFLKDTLGTQDEASALRRKFRGIRASQAAKNLPPGPASDKDIALALSGFPPDNAPAEVISSFLVGASKLARIDNAFQTFKAEYISENRNSSGLIKAWRVNKDRIISDALGTPGALGGGQVLNFDEHGNLIE
jgi:hypothetical protein